MKYVRDKHIILELNDEHEVIRRTEFKSINKAKRHNRTKLGGVAHKFEKTGGNFKQANDCVMEAV